MMLAPGQTMPIERSQLYSLLVELLELRALVTRLGADMTTAATDRTRSPMSIDAGPNLG